MDESEEAADGGGFAGAVGSEESVDCACGDGEVDVVEYPGFPEILAELRNLNRISVHIPNSMQVLYCLQTLIYNV